VDFLLFFFNYGLVVINLFFSFLLIFRVLFMFVTFFFGQAVEQSLELMRVRMEEMTLRMKAAEQHWQDLIKTSGQGGNGLSVRFEQYVRGILATGCSARSARGTIAMSASTFLAAEAFKELDAVLPLERWFRTQREGLGNEAWTYAMIRLAGAEKILQWGFDETKLDGVSTMNQWVLLQEGDKPPEVLTIQVAGLTIGGTAQETADHVAKSWELGQEAVLLVRNALGPDWCELVPLARGGVLLHKIKGAMHDTCNTANLVPHLVLEMRDTSGRLHYGQAEWEALPAGERSWFDYLCGNHSRNLPLDEWNREFECYIKDALGEAIAEVQRRSNCYAGEKRYGCVPCRPSRTSRRSMASAS
jgi:hypothetical protein